MKEFKGLRVPEIVYQTEATISEIREFQNHLCKCKAIDNSMCWTNENCKTCILSNDNTESFAELYNIKIVEE